MGGVGEFLAGKIDVQVVWLRRIIEPIEVLAPPENRGAALGVVTPDALEDAGAVVEAVGQHVDLGVLPVDELAVHPDRVDVHVV